MSAIEQPAPAFTGRQAWALVWALAAALVARLFFAIWPSCSGCHFHSKKAFITPSKFKPYARLTLRIRPNTGAKSARDHGIWGAPCDPQKEFASQSPVRHPPPFACNPQFGNYLLRRGVRSMLHKSQVPPLFA